MRRVEYLHREEGPLDLSSFHPSLTREASPGQRRPARRGESGVTPDSQVKTQDVCQRGSSLSPLPSARENTGVEHPELENKRHSARQTL